MACLALTVLRQLFTQYATKGPDVGPIETISLDQPTRREFCANACTTASLLTLAAFLQGCGSSSSPTSPSNVPALPTVSGTAVTGGVTVPVGGTSPLATTGGAALVQSGSSVFLVSRSSATAFVALTAICTHEGCTVSGFESQTYVCPCHGSRYNLSGGVVQGPAPAALHQFATDVANDVLTIHT